MKWRNSWFLLLLVFLLASLAQLVLPWWSLAVVAFAVGFALAPMGRAGFWAGFGGAGLSWLLPAAGLAYQNEGLPLGGSVTILVVVAGLVAGLVGGLAGLAGAWLRAALPGGFIKTR